MEQNFVWPRLQFLGLAWLDVMPIISNAYKKIRTLYNCNAYIIRTLG